MRMRPRVATVAALIVVLALTAAASGASARPTSRQDTVTLRMLAAASQQVAMDVLIANFQRVYPNIKIDVQYAVSAQVPIILLTQLQAGNAPDIFRIQGGVAQSGVWTIASAGRLLDLTGRKWQSRIYPPAKNLYMFNGKVYGWPLTVNPYAVLYNTDLFKQLKLTVPTRFADFLTMCKKITAAGKIPVVQPWGSISAANIIAPQRAAEYVYSVDPNWNDKRTKKLVTFSTSPGWRRALQSIVDMKDANCFQPTPQGMTSRPSQYAAFAAGDAAMTVIASSELANFTAINPNLHYGIFNLPADDPKKSVLLAGHEVDEGLHLVRMGRRRVAGDPDRGAREQQSRLFAKVSGEIAPLDVKKANLPAYMKPYLGPMFAAGKHIELTTRTWPNASVFDQGLATGTLGLFTGQTTVDSILKKMDELWDQG